MFGTKCYPAALLGKQGNLFSGVNQSYLGLIIPFPKIGAYQHPLSRML